MDYSQKDSKYFTSGRTYNCPFCKRGSVAFTIEDKGNFSTSRQKNVYYYIIRCKELECNKKSFHLSRYNLVIKKNSDSADSYFIEPPTEETVGYERTPKFTVPFPQKVIRNSDGKDLKELDKVFHCHMPTSFFTLNELIPEEIRKSLSEAENCLSNNFLTGASGCLRKAMYKLLKHQEIPHLEGDSYINFDVRIDKLQAKFPGIETSLFEHLKIIQDLTSQELHENDWNDYDGSTIKFLIELIKKHILYEIYILPVERGIKREKLSQLSRISRSSERKKK